MVGVYVPVILVAAMVLFGALCIAIYYDELVEARRRKMVMDVCDKIIPKLFDEMMNRMDDMMEATLNKSIGMAKKLDDLDD